MNWWINAAQYATIAFAVMLIYRLVSLRHSKDHVYWMFVAFPLIRVMETLGYFAYYRWGQFKIDYRIIWIANTAIVSLFALWLVYALAKAVLAELPGILRFSRNLLNIAFPLAIVIAFSTAHSEYDVTRGASFADPLDRLTFLFSVADRGISIAAVLVLIAILAFILWFPVKMSKNVAIFSVGFVVYFSSKAAIDLFNNYMSPTARTTSILSICNSLILLSCLAYWAVFVDRRGQTAQVRFGHGWHVAEQGKLVEQLEALNVVLMRSSQRIQL